jgi:ubiquinone/menaquinone biosynthesis C-methylase UbiE
MIDNFSAASEQYALYRPGYPDELFAYLQTLLTQRSRAWDCGTGNGQVAVKLSAVFDQVYATDISAAQLAQAVQRPNIYYSQQAAEQTNFPDTFFDLVVVAQAIHWFDFEKFYEEVQRTANTGAVLAVVGYGKICIRPEVDALVNHLYYDIAGPYWNKERRYVDEDYRTIPFPFSEIKTPAFTNEYEWSLEQLIGYLRTWSAVKHYQKQNGDDPVAIIIPQLKQVWGQNTKQKISFPLLLRVGRIGIKQDQC